MKTKLSFVLVMFFITFLSNIAFSQVGNTIVDTNSVWSINNQIVYPTSPTSYYIHLKGDTIIDSKQYTKLWTNNDLSLTDDMDFYGLIREENQKTYLRVFESSTDTLFNESLLYDFSLSNGDVFTINALDTVFNFSVIVDSIVVNNIMYKRISLSNSILSDITWVEKIGSLERGLFYGLNVFNDGVREDLLCYYYNDICLYSNPNFNYCVIGLDNPLNQECKTSIYPNPFKDFLNIYSNDLISMIEVLDMEGRLLISKEGINNISYCADLYSLTKGVYILKLLFMNGNFASYKLLKQ